MGRSGGTAKVKRKTRKRLGKVQAKRLAKNATRNR